MTTRFPEEFAGVTDEDMRITWRGKLIKSVKPHQNPDDHPASRVTLHLSDRLDASKFKIGERGTLKIACFLRFGRSPDVFMWGVVEPFLWNKMVVVSSTPMPAGAGDVVVLETVDGKPLI